MYAENVAQLEEAMEAIYRQYSQGYQHDYRQRYQILVVDMSGMPCGPKAAFASKGYFAKQRNRRGRQLGRVLASYSHEVVVDRLFDGTMQLNKALLPLMQAAEQTLGLDEHSRTRTLVRVDAGGGSVNDVNWLLAQQCLAVSKRPKLPPSAQIYTSSPELCDNRHHYTCEEIHHGRISDHPALSGGGSQS